MLSSPLSVLSSRVLRPAQLQKQMQLQSGYKNQCNSKAVTTTNGTPKRLQQQMQVESGDEYRLLCLPNHSKSASWILGMRHPPPMT
jgi:hypothetical protein